jgi:carboxylate-amine ligase
VVGQLLAYVRPPLERWGEWDEVSSLVARTLAQGNGARRQRQAFARAGRMEGVVDLIIAETASGLGGGGCPRE